MPLTMARYQKERAMSKVENKSQVVKKEIIKFGPNDPTHYTWLENTISDNAIAVLSKIAEVNGIGRMGYKLGFSNNETRLLTFKKLADFKSEKNKVISLSNVKAAMKEYTQHELAKIDKDGYIVFKDLFTEILKERKEYNKKRAVYQSSLLQYGNILLVTEGDD